MSSDLSVTISCNASPKISTRFPMVNFMSLVNAGNSLIGGILQKTILASGNLVLSSLIKERTSDFHFDGRLSSKASFPPSPITIKSTLLSAIVGIKSFLTFFAV